MDKTEMKQICLDLSKAAGTLFDIIDEKDDINAVMDGALGVLALAEVMINTNKMREYYARQNIQRMLALGISPEELARMDLGR